MEGEDMSPNSNTRYSRILLALVALVLIAFSLWGLASQPISASALSLLNPARTPTPCHPPKCTPTPKPTRTHTPTPTRTHTPTPTPTTTATATATASTTQTPIATVGLSTPLAGDTVTPNDTPATDTPTPSQPTQTVSNGNPPPSDNGNSGGGSTGSMFTTIALVVGMLAFLLYLIPQRGASSSILNKILSLILPASIVRRMDDE